MHATACNRSRAAIRSGLAVLLCLYSLSAVAPLTGDASPTCAMACCVKEGVCCCVSGPEKTATDTVQRIRVAASLEAACPQGCDLALSHASSVVLPRAMSPRHHATARRLVARTITATLPSLDVDSDPSAPRAPPILL